MVLDYESFWSVRGKIPPYIIPEQPLSTITQLQDSLNYCTPRIQRTRNPEVSWKLAINVGVIVEIYTYFGIL